MSSFLFHSAFLSRNQNTSISQDNTNHHYLSNCCHPFWARTLKDCSGTRVSESDPEGRPAWIRFVCPAHPTDAHCAYNCENLQAQSTVVLTFVQHSIVWLLEPSWGHSESVRDLTHQIMVKLLSAAFLSLLEFHLYQLSAFTQNRITCTEMLLLNVE